MLTNEPDVRKWSYVKSHLAEQTRQKPMSTKTSKMNEMSELIIQVKEAVNGIDKTVFFI